MFLKKVILPVAIASMSIFGVAGCKGVKAGGPSVIQIKAYKGGYGTDFLHQMADEYHQAHPEISFEFLEESATVLGDKAKAEIALPNKNQTDLYLLNGIDIDTILQRSYSVLKKRDVVLLEPLDDILDSKAIGLDGQEEQETIRSRMFEGFEEACQYNGSFRKWAGKTFFLPWADASTGLFVNKPVLDKYGLDIPLTSNEFKTVVETIYTEGKADGVYPFSWAGNNAPGYWLYLFETWFGQYSTKTNFDNFVKCDPGNGKVVEEGYKVYQDQGILKALEAMFDILDLKYSPNGSFTKAHIEAQSEFVRGKTVFMCDGEWILNEMKRDYFEEAKNVVMIGVPILSCIGEEIGITDAELHTLVESIDNHLSNDEIKALIPSLTDANIERVLNARSIHDSIGPGHTMIVPSYSDAKKATKEFIRYMFSNDGCRTFRNYAYGNLPFSYTKQEGDSNTPFQQSLDKITDYPNPQIVCSCAHFNNVREIAQLYVFNYSGWQHPNTFVAIMVDKSSDSPKYSPKYIFETEATFVQNDWSKYMNYITYL